MIKAIVFDIGQTLVDYSAPLSWAELYSAAFAHTAEENGFMLSEEENAHIVRTLSRYNSREYPRDEEVSSDIIFSEIIGGTRIPPECLEGVKRSFFGFFSRAARVCPEAEEVLKELKRAGVPTGTLSDVPYGMDNEFIHADMGPLKALIDFPYTSNDIGLRKPRPEGLWLLAERMGVSVEELAFVGDEDKDMECARRAGAHAIFIDREGGGESFGQELTIRDLTELLPLIG